ncbi:DUF190 domain-containing protein [Clostridium sp.]|uniref:DUF190 domain-containing protein n=1 Tax=Clostridium sp. TaxID=1506 RepID=UPI002FCC3DF4
MEERSKGKLVKIFIEGNDKYDGKPLYTAIIDKLKSSEISGATIIRGIEGFGEDKEIHADFIEVLSRKLPIVIDIVTTEKRADEIIKIVAPMIKTGKIAIMDNVDVITFKK